MKVNIGVYVEKYAWMLNILLLVLLALIVAITTNNCVRTSYALPENIEPWTPPTLEETTTDEALKIDLKAIENRNLFNSQIREDAAPVEPTEVIETNVNLCVQGIVVGPHWRFATIQDKTNNRVMVLGEGEEVAPGLTIFSIEPDRIITARSNGQKEESLLDFLSKCSGGPRGSRPPTGPNTRRPPTRPPTSRPGGVQAISETEYVIDRDEFDAQMSDLNRLVTEARMVPNFTPDRQVDGFRIFQIKPGSIYQKLGLRNGDVIERVNGIKLDDPTKGLELFQALQNQSNFTIDLKRHNRKTTFTYDVR